MTSLLLEVGPTQAEEAVTALLPVCLTGFPFCFSPDVVQHVTKGATTTTMTIRSDWNISEEEEEAAMGDEDKADVPGGADGSRLAQLEEENRWGEWHQLSNCAG